ncbi:TPR-like protein [Hyphopichia burtonii NRRL Y-1933]|uniref:TPR-like protein n=1 Tax=Hyphopichia burtonii NRRL Y-1933 TaxID=984485 RepID=A0A1E4RRA6_9ASCO|nr:TPR-like protein [Hyphopichia burtonii NRRL Y-1933]ODV69595.1 TPR-like protein [Hyphopichia burtonii NRRL Y-1933]
MDVKKVLRQALSQLVLLVPAEKFTTAFESTPELRSIQEPVLYILRGESSQLLVNQDYSSLILNEESKNILKEFPFKSLDVVLKEFVDRVVRNFGDHFQNEELASIHLQLIAISLLQVFIQINVTGPNIDYSSRELLFNDIDETLLQLESVKLLALEGQTAYDLMVDPLFLILATLIFERLSNVESKFSVIAKNKDVSIDDIATVTSKFIESLNDDPIQSSLQWWRARCSQVHLCVLNEPPSVLSSLSSLLLSPSIVNSLCPASDNNLELQKHVQLSYFLECARSGIHAGTEHLSIPFLAKARKVSELSFVLSGAKAKRTKFQKFHTSALIVLAKSNKTALFDVAKENEDSNPESLNLNDETLLERPQFESLDDLEMEDDGPSSKKLKLDDLAEISNEDEQLEKLLPIALRQEDIPEDLRELDPNEQPALNDLDNVQLLLRLWTIKQTSPSGNALVEEELGALVARILYSDTKSSNWSIFARALWERSVLETNKARTIERGILQMTSLVEEIGIKIKSRMIPQAQEDGEVQATSASASRLRFIHQLPFMPQWAMDARLAEKYMSIGVLRSAIEIYERLNMTCEAALCYAAVDNEAEAEKILMERIKSHPEDARAISILGDIKQDPDLWLKSWEIGKYYKAKASLSRYFYSPPPSSGLTKNIELAIKNMNECLTVHPLSYEHWFFYGCCGLESQQFELAAEAFTRCVALDDTNSHAYSNLATALLHTDKIRPAFNALKKAIRSAGEGKKSWRIYENYLIVAAKLNEWNDVLLAAKEVLLIKSQSEGELSIDIPVLEKLVEVLVSTEYPKGENARLTHYQSSCIDLICNMLPNVINTSARCWRLISRVELWRGRPWSALECHEKAYRAVSQRTELETDETVWNDAVEACSDLIAAYESLGELPGKHDAGDVVCKDWRYKARTTVRSLMSKGKAMWEDSEGWERLQGMKEDLVN